MSDLPTPRRWIDNLRDDAAMFVHSTDAGERNFGRNILRLIEEAANLRSLLEQTEKDRDDAQDDLHVAEFDRTELRGVRDELRERVERIRGIASRTDYTAAYDVLGDLRAALSESPRETRCPSCWMNPPDHRYEDCPEHKGASK